MAPPGDCFSFMKRKPEVNLIDVGNIFILLIVCLFVCLSGRLPQRKESGCPIRDSASRPGVGVGNTPYQVLPSVSERAWVRTNIPNS